jgi:hypothetical protein
MYNLTVPKRLSIEFFLQKWRPGFLQVAIQYRLDHLSRELRHPWRSRLPPRTVQTIQI